MKERIGKYALQGRIGSGSTGTVYLAFDPDLGRRVAIKELAPRLAGDPTFLRRFRAEAETMARLNHANCVKVFDFFEKRGSAYLVAEFVDGASLREVLNQAKKLTPRQALGVLKGALLGLAHAHSLGLVHRDIKPENLLCDREGTSKLADFGLTTSSTEQGVPALGSPLYMSPEQVKGGPVDQRSDIYGCGAVLFEFLTGRPPFVADNPLAVMKKHETEPPPSPRQVNRRLPAAVSALVLSAMAKAPGARPQSAEAFLALLEKAANTAYGVGWETGASIAGLTAAAISAGAAAAAASTAATGDAVGGAQVAGSTVAVGTAATGAGAIGGGGAQGAPGPSGTATGGGSVRSRITRVGPARVAIIAVIAIAILAAGSYGASKVISQSQARATSRPSSPSTSASPPIGDACLVGRWVNQNTDQHIGFIVNNQQVPVSGRRGLAITFSADGTEVYDFNSSEPLTGGPWQITTRGMVSFHVMADGAQYTEQGPGGGTTQIYTLNGVQQGPSSTANLSPGINNHYTCNSTMLVTTYVKTNPAAVYTDNLVRS